MKVIFGIALASLVLAGCVEREAERTPVSVPLTTSDAAEEPTIRITGYPKEVAPGEHFECSGEIIIPPSLETKYTPKLYILRDGASMDEMRITAFESDPSGVVTFEREVSAPMAPRKYDLRATVLVVPHASGRGAQETVVESPLAPFEVIEP